MTDQIVEIGPPAEDDRRSSRETQGVAPASEVGSGQAGAPKRPKAKRKAGRPKKSEQRQVARLVEQPSKPAEPAASESAKKGKRRGGPATKPGSFVLGAANASHEGAIDELAKEAGQFPGGETRQKRLTDVHALGEELEKEVWSMLENGSYFDETAAYINQRHTPGKAGGPQGISIEAVKRYFRGSKQLQARRVKRMQEVTREIKKELVGKPDAAEADVIDAIIFTGLMGLDRDAMPEGVSEAAKHYVACQALRMKQRMHNEKVRTERVQRRVMKRKLEELTRALNQENGGRALGPETLERIREIYGLFAKPIGPPGSAAILGASGESGPEAPT